MPKVSEAYLDERRQQIIDAAYRCFARKGLHETTMRDIYAEAELSSGAVYHYFRSKEAIIEASFVLDYERSLPVFEQVASREDPVAALGELIDFFYAGLEGASALGADRVNVQGWGEALYTPRLAAPLREFLGRFGELVAGLVRRGQEAGLINAGVDAEATGQVVLSSFLGLYLQKAIVPEMEVGRYKQTVKTLLQGGIVKPG